MKAQCIIGRSFTTTTAFFGVFALSILYVFPILVANTPYSDDIYRSFSGAFGWGGMGRPLSDLAVGILSLSSNRVVDVSPLSQLVASVAMSGAVVLGVRSIGLSLNFLNLAIFSLILLNPFFIQNLAYKFDSAPMALAVLSSVFGLYFSGLDKWYFKAASIAALVASLSLYQPCATLFIPLFFCRLLLSAENNQHEGKIAISIISHASIFLIAYVVYYLFVAIPFTEGNPRAETISFSVTGMGLLFENISKMIDMLNLITPVYGGLINACAVLLGTAAFSIAAIRYFVKKMTVLSAITLLTLPFLPVLGFLLSAGPVLIMEESLIFSRTLVGFGGFLVMVLFSISRFGAVGSVASGILATLLICNSLIMSSAFANTQKIQRDFEDSVNQLVVQDILERDLLNDRKVFVGGASTTSPVVNVIINEIPLMRKIYNPGYDWTNSMALQRVGVNVSFSFNRGERQSAVEALCSRSESLVKSNQFYSLRVNEEYAVFWMKGINDIC